MWVLEWNIFFSWHDFSVGQRNLLKKKKLWVKSAVNVVKGSLVFVCSEDDRHVIPFFFCQCWRYVWKLIFCNLTIGTITRFGWFTSSFVSFFFLVIHNGKEFSVIVLFNFFFFGIGPRYRRPKKEKPKDAPPDEKRPRTAFSSEQLARLKVSFEIIFYGI